MHELDVNRRIASFSDLSKAYHSAASKVLVCQECIASGLDSKIFARNHSIPETSMLRMMRQHQADALSGISTFRDSGSGRPPKLDAISEAISELFRSVAEIKKRPTGLNLSQSCLRRLSRLQNPGIEEVQEEYRFGRESWSAKNRRKDRC